MKRWHDDFPISYREWKKHHRSHVESNVERNVLCEDDVCRDIWKVDCPCDTQIGRFRKKDAWDCGNTRCYICHGDKYPKRDITYQEWCAELKHKEGIEEYLEGLEEADGGCLTPEIRRSNERRGKTEEAGGNPGEDSLREDEGGDGTTRRDQAA